MTSPRKIKEIATEIKGSWKNVSPYAEPYLKAMLTLEKIEDVYILDDAENIILRFLNNAQSWRGDTARRIKLELKALCN